MTDYGQELAFGTFLTPDAARPDDVVELALLTEAAGLDLATFQDHPYQSRFLDAWALAATVLARTTTLRVTTNVTNLPLRPPFVLAKTVASLDRLSRGRVELGLGAGAFWEAIEAAGGPRRTGGEARAALAEGIDIIRATWDDSRRAVRVEGRHYRAAGVHPGPAPAHPVEIWIGAVGPRMLALTGQVGDGWLPSQAYVPPEALADGSARIDDAALAAGREPAAVRRLYNVNPSTDPGWAEWLAELTLTHGTSTFIMAGDDPRSIGRFGTEVAPAVRALVEAERSRTAAAEPPSAAATAATAARADEVVEVRRGRPVEPTADPGVRRSGATPWDEASRPTYVSSLRPLTWTDHERASGQHLVDIHDHLRGELARLYDLIDQVEAGTMDAGRARSLINEMTLRQNDWALGAYCQSYCRLVTTHHTIEDTSMFPHLRASDPELSPVIDRLEEEHHAIARVLDDVDRALVSVVSGVHDTAPLRASVDLLADTMTSHLSYEERELVEPLARFGYTAG
ncbi:LLM class flavin-dependent oxidoreductase [Nocardioides sambongensis]|uniref:LLM class flavin-dependent oxidoreductase n=1 Tax=Nocardioides sambongensis TaxID=2589074 RepID=UPI001129A098|nr:LLM class flavin-dependent oxidoreductase [Nocardioides sambongensis]